MFNKQSLIQDNTFKWIFGLAIFVRIIAVFFSQGYGMHDDHFLIIESSGSWVDGFDYNHWLPSHPDNIGPEGHSFTYVGINYYYFLMLKTLGISDPKVLMIFNRFLHAALSMIVVLYGVKITAKISSIQNAKIVGWLLALLWVIPFLSVRNLVETTAIPFLILGVWFLLREQKKIDYLWAGMLIGLAVSFRYQIGVFALAIAAIYFLQQKWKPFLLFCSGVLILFIFTQGFVDFIIWGYPFAELWSYVNYNMKQGTEYMPNTNYFMYFLVLIGVMLVPMGFLLFAGFIKTWRKHFLLFIPTLVFILFHTFYPNRQERFVLSILPFFIILGVIGYSMFTQSHRVQKWWRISWIIFWALNIPMLVVATFTYSKKSRVEAMYSIYNDGIKNETILMEGTGGNRVSMLPRFYSGEWGSTIMERTSSEQPLVELYKEPVKLDYIFFFEETNLKKRIIEYKAIYPNMNIVKKCNPSLIDQLLRYLNPNNSNEYIEVWKTNAVK